MKQQNHRIPKIMATSGPFYRPEVPVMIPGNRHLWQEWPEFIKELFIAHPTKTEIYMEPAAACSVLNDLFNSKHQLEDVQKMLRDYAYVPQKGHLILRSDFFKEVQS